MADAYLVAAPGRRRCRPSVSTSASACSSMPSSSFRDNRALTRRLKEAKLRMPARVSRRSRLQPRDAAWIAPLIRQLAVVSLDRRASERPDHRRHRRRQDLSGLCARASRPVARATASIYRRLPRLFAELALAHADGSYIAAAGAPRARRCPRARRLGPRRGQGSATATTCSRSSRTAMARGRR